MLFSRFYNFYDVFLNSVFCEIRRAKILKDDDDFLEFDITILEPIASFLTMFFEFEAILFAEVETVGSNWAVKGAIYTGDGSNKITFVVTGRGWGSWDWGHVTIMEWILFEI